MLSWAKSIYAGGHLTVSSKWVFRACDNTNRRSGPWHSVPGVLSSFVSAVWCTDFHTFHGDQWNSCHTMGDKFRQEAGSWALSRALMVSELFWWRYFFKLYPVRRSTYVVLGGAIQKDPLTTSSQYINLYNILSTAQIKKLKKKKKKTQVIRSALCPDFVIPRGLSTLYRCSLTTLAQDKPYHEIPLIRDCCNHKGSCTL